MNDTPMNRADPERLISRIVDGEATPGDWSEFRLQAEREPSLWRDLAEAQRLQGEFVDEVAMAVSSAARVDVPVHTEMVRQMSDRLRKVGIWGGWAAAACIGLMWAGVGPAQNPGLTSGVPLNLTSGQTLDQYLSKGQSEGKVLGEMPEKVLVRARPLTDSSSPDITGYEVVYVRQILERTVVKDLYRLGRR